MINKKILVTGAGGFCGSHLTRYLNKNGLQVHSLGPRTAATPNHHHIADITDIAALDRILRNVQPDYVFHLAGASRSRDPILFYRVNVQYAVALLEALDTAGLASTPVLFMGSGAEYGMVAQEQLPIREDLPPRPYNHYGISKLAQTLEGLAASHAGRPIIVARPFNIIGQGMPEYISVQSFASQIVDIIRSKKEPSLNVGNLDAVRDFVDVRDVVRILWDIVRAPAAYGEVVNICSGRGTLMADIVSKLIALSGMPIKIIVDPSRLKPIDVPVHVGSNHKLNTILKYVPKTDIEDTLTSILDGMRTS